MRKFLPVLLVATLLLLAAAPAFADVRRGLQLSQPLESTGVFTNQAGNTMDYACWVYGISIYADASSSYMGVYDCDTSNEVNASGIYPKGGEIGEATQYDTQTIWYEKPKYFEDGVAAIIFTGVGFVWYGPSP